jgi:hypothetical protein
MITKKLTIPLLSISLLGLLLANNLVEKNSTNNSNNNIDELLNEINLEQEDPEHIITIFVHGTILPIPSLKILRKTLKDKNCNSSFYQKYLNNLRRDTIYNYQPINDFGLIKIELNRPAPYFSKNKYNYLTAKTYQYFHNECDTCKNNPSPHGHHNLPGCHSLGDDGSDGGRWLRTINKTFSFYTFGWNGRLDHKKRVRAAQDLYNALTKELERVKQEKPNSKIKIEILAHSHGGNVALNLAAAEEKNKKNLCIDKLVLLGTPIQSETKSYVNSPIFKKVYNIYSTGDAIQTLDIFSTKDPASKRRVNIETPESKLAQIKIKAEKYYPGHCELWLWGKKSSPLYYRKSLPTYPFPIAVFTPIITSSIDVNLSTAKNIDLYIKKETNFLKFTFHDVNASSSINPGKERNLVQKNSEKLETLTHIEKLKNQIKQKIL